MAQESSKKNNIIVLGVVIAVIAVALGADALWLRRDFDKI